MPLPAGIWRSRTTADLFAVGERACRTYTLYDDVAALTDETDLSDVEGKFWKLTWTTKATWKWSIGNGNPVPIRADGRLAGAATP